MDSIGGLRISWRNIRDHKLRSTLTTLGVVIGVAAVITFVTLGASLQASIIQTVAGENTNVMYVSATSEEGNAVPNLARPGSAVFTQHDVEQLRGVEGVRSVIPTGGIATTAVSYENDTVGRQWVTVTTPQYFQAKGISFAAGRPYRDGRREVVLNRQAATMFSDNVSVGDRIVLTRAANQERLNATVVGIVQEVTGNQPSFLAQESGPAIYAPPDPYYERTVASPSTRRSQRVYGRILVTVDDFDRIQSVQGRVYTYLGEESDASILKSDGYKFKVTTYDQLVNQIKEVSNTFTAYITGIALVSLVVGAIGIANIMLVSVTERTREIGIMKAIGARKRDILQIFLVEAVLLGVFGAILGTLIGFVGGYVGTTLLSLPLRFQAIWFVISVLVGVLVGVGAGIYPAWNATRTNPIEALRHE